MFVQKGYQIHGTAEIINKTYSNFDKMESILIKMTEGKFPFWSITQITIEKVKKIIAPKYILYPETSEKEQIKSAKKLYGV